jgi:hypothetical protein
MVVVIVTFLLARGESELRRREDGFAQDEAAARLPSRASRTRLLRGTP